MATSLQDLRFGIRTLLKSPGFTLITIITLALGFGANTAMFSVINTVVLTPLPFPDSKRLVAIESRTVRNPTGSKVASYPDFIDWKAQNRSFAGMAAYHSTHFTLTNSGGDALDSSGVVTTPEFFSILQVSPEKGRVFAAGEDVPGVGNVAVISDSLWKRRFQGSEEILGRTINLDSRAYTVIGVMPPGFNFPVEREPADVWATIAYDVLDAPLGEQPITTERGAHYLQVIARLRPGVPMERAQAEMNGVVGSLNQQFSEGAARTATLVPQLEQVVGEIRPALLILFAAVGLVLLIACANVASLLFARLTGRQKELGLRLALGASRGRIVQQLFVESLILSSFGGIVGLGLAWLAVKICLKMDPANLPRITTIAIDGKVFGFAFASVIVTTFIFGVAPAIQAWKPELVQAIREGGYGGFEGIRQNRLRQALVACEIALTVILLTGTSLLIQSLVHLQHVDPGFDPRNTLTMNVPLPSSRYSDAQTRTFYRQLLTQVREIPGVHSVAAVSPLPLADDGLSIPFDIERHPTAKQQRPRAGFVVVSPGYFRTMNITVPDGREFTEQDDEGTQPVIIVNSVLAKRFFPNENAIGEYMKLAIGGANSPLRQIVGVVDSVKSSGLNEEPVPEMYVPYTQIPNSMALVIRTDVEPMSIVGSVRKVTSSLDPELAVSQVETMDSYVAASTLQPRFNSLLLSLFAGIGLVLTTVGLYGVVSQAVNYRRREIAIRISIGAQKSDIVGLVLRQAIVLCLIGICLGCAGAFAFNHLMASMLFKVTSTDPITYVAVAIFLAAIALLASYVPARHATSVSPLLVLK